MTKITNPYLTIVNKHIKYNPSMFKDFEYETVAVSDGDWGKSTALIERETKRAYDKVLEDFELVGISAKLMSARRSNFDQLYAQGETFLKKLNDDTLEILNKENPNFQTENTKLKKIYKKFVTVLKNPKLVKIANQHQKTFAARLGHSEHHLGLAIDISVDMRNVKIPDKIREKYPNASQGELNFITRRLILEKHGFILSYPDSPRLEAATGIKKKEPWHWRYIGAEHSQMIARIRENVGEMLGEKQEVFLEDYVHLLNQDIEAESEQELVEKYSNLFITDILNRQINKETTL